MKKIETFEELYEAVKELYPDVIKVNDYRTFFNNGFIVKKLFSCVNWIGLKRYGFYRFKKNLKKNFKKEFLKRKRWDEIKDPNKILKVIKSIKECENV